MTDVPWPFLGVEALGARAISARTMHLLYEPIHPGVYVAWGAAPTARQRAEAAWLWSRRRGVLAGQSAAVLLGAKWVDDDEPAEVIHRNRRHPPNVVVRTETLAPGEIVRVGAMAVTSAARTAFDIGRHTRSEIVAVRRLDALANATGVRRADVEAVAGAHPGARHLGRLRRVLPRVDGGAESPQETVARLALVDAGLPAPRTQVEIRDRLGRFVARVDMAYEEVKVAIEYDGLQHWTDAHVRQRDIDKGVAFDELGWLVIRVGSELLHRRRATYVDRVERALRARGMVW